jgi:MFS family permease
VPDVPVMSAGYRRYVLALMTLVFTLNFVDRSLLALLLEPIKHDLQLSDTQLGFLTGIAFAFFYATLGLPLARWADRGNRVTLTACAIGLWGLTVMACIGVRNFTHLVFARVAAGVGEAGCMPPTYSLLGDYFPEADERTRAMAVYWLASPLAALISFVAGGWLDERYGWRMTFFIMGLPAIGVALIVKLTVREPRLVLNSTAVAKSVTPPLRQVMKGLWECKSTCHLSIAIVLLYTLALGMSPWYAAFMIRTHELGTAELGLWMGMIFAIGGAFGILSGGHIAARWFPHDARRQLQLSAVMIALLVPCYLAFLLLPGGRQALAMLFPLVAVFSCIYGPIFALLQRLVPDDTRAITMAIVLLFANLIGMGLGPQIVGLLSDALAPHLGTNSLRWAMSAMSMVAVWSAHHFWRAGESIREDLGRVPQGRCLSIMLNGR